MLVAEVSNNQAKMVKKKINNMIYRHNHSNVYYCNSSVKPGDC